ncbi:DUF6318 family protein [Kineococcus sp. SYSU DK003]|uniref:DUF6318 family protein n=1 Tax=Kineococcus sp. SYSU DK003 TaxID=3383124 RepID=UPI003D7E85EF
MIQLRPASIAVAGLAVAGLVAGCSNETAPTVPAAAKPVATTPADTALEASASPDTSSQPAPTATRVLPAPELSELGTTFTQDGASAFAGYYVQVLNYSRNSGDAGPLRAISDAGCSGCSYNIDEIQKMLEGGYSHVGLETRFRGTWYLQWSPDIGEIQMDVYVDRDPHVIVDENGREAAQIPGAKEASFFLWLKWVDGRWLVWETE